jgi:hypothetical protein
MDRQSALSAKVLVKEKQVRQIIQNEVLKAWNMKKNVPTARGPGNAGTVMV